jgi:hypothetical protein
MRKGEGTGAGRERVKGCLRRMRERWKEREREREREREKDR